MTFHTALAPVRANHIRRPLPPPSSEAAGGTRSGAPAGRPACAPEPQPLPPHTEAAREAYLQATTPAPGAKSRFRLLGPVRMLVCFWQDRMALLQIHSDSRRQGHGSQALAKLISIAERHGLIIVANALPLSHARDCLNQRELTAWYLGFGFELVPGSTMNGIIYTPASHSGAPPA